MLNQVRLVVVAYLWRIVSLLFPMRFWLNRVTPANLQADFWAGITGAVIVLPQGIAFALIAGLPPEFGLYSAIVVQLIAGFFGSSWQMVSGPTVALSIVIPSIVSPYAVIGTPQYIGMTLTLMFLVGLIQLAFGVFRLGGLVNFISHTVIIGFTAGAGTLIIASQLPTALGLTLPRGLTFFEKWQAMYEHVSDVEWYSVLIAFATIVAAVAVKRHNRRLPHILIGVMIGSLVAVLIDAVAHDVRMLGTLPTAMPQMIMPDVHFRLVSELLPSAFALALLGLIEAVSIARSIAVRSHQRIDGNQEFFGQGLSNVVGSFFSCYVGSGSFNRSAMNYDSGAKTPLALLVTSLCIVLVLVIAPNVTRYLPMPAMAGAIVLAGYNLFDFKHINIIFKTSKSEMSIILVTFLSTLLLDLEFAIYAGVILSLILYLQKTSHPTVKKVNFSAVYEQLDAGAQQAYSKHPPISAVHIDGSLFFGAVNHVQHCFDVIGEHEHWQHLVILAEGVNIIDIAGIEFLLHERERLQRRGGDLFVIGLKGHVRNTLRKSPYWVELGGDTHLYESTYVAFRSVCKAVNIENYRQYMKNLFIDYNKLY